MFRELKHLEAFAFLSAARERPTFFYQGFYQLSQSSTATMAETMTLRATLKAHSGWVTSIATPLDPASNMLLSASR
jgi:hypothetical protein